MDPAVAQVLQAAAGERISPPLLPHPTRQPLHLPCLTRDHTENRLTQTLQNSYAIFSSVFLAAYGEAAMHHIYPRLHNRFGYVAGFLARWWRTTRFRCVGDTDVLHAVWFSWFMPNLYMRITTANSRHARDPAARSAARLAFYAEALRSISGPFNCLVRLPPAFVSTADRLVLVALGFLGPLCCDMHMLERA